LDRQEEGLGQGEQQQEAEDVPHHRPTGPARGHFPVGCSTPARVGSFR
jgi:hypothetical protein